MLVLREAHDTRKLAGLIPTYASIRVELPGLARPDAAALADRLARDYLECGCTAGARALLAGLAIAIAAAALAAVAGRSPTPQQGLQSMALVLTWTVVVKYAVVVRARIRLHGALRRLPTAAR